MKLAKVILIAMMFAFIGSAPSFSQTILQGGDNIDNAYIIPSPNFSDSGTTVGYTDDYDGNCGEDNGAPDVVYKYTPDHIVGIWAGLCNRQPDFYSRLYVFQDTPDSIVACDMFGCYSTSAPYIKQFGDLGVCAVLLPGHTYYFVIDGMGGFGYDAGNYWFNIETPSIPPALSGTVTDDEGAPVEGAFVMLLKNGVEILRDTTDENGMYGSPDFSYNIVPDTYTVEAWKLGFVPHESDPYFLGVCMSYLVLDIRIFRESPPPVGSLSGFVMETDSLTPIEGALIVATDEYGYSYYDTTSAEGLYIIPDMQLYFYDVTASKEYFVSQTVNDVEILMDQTTVVDFYLQRELCPYAPGDVNGNGSWNGLDIVYTVSYFKGGPTPILDCHPYCPNQPDPFFAGGDVNGDCVFNGLDIVFFVTYLKGWLPELRYCPECPPGM